ncbi:MAG: SUMF1/EgtB/PvdO family nonheme iron enzyme [Planctomycetes bacterium]|nr:SUMF1/EgtB/PvdO family nonheme iron enzyme [Planctomycetota bacterium]
MPTHQELPEQFGRYRILKKLGAGGMGAVYLAEDARLRRKVALKVPHFTPGTRGPVLERFQREARLAAAIDHPNFCPLHDVDEIDGIHFFTMTYVEGTPLAELITEGQAWPAAQAVDLVRRVALAVGELHTRGIVHRDLKPGNIMLRPSGEPVLMDFGLACAVTSQSERLTGTGQVLGTLAYMPPEQLEGDRARLGPAADVYSLGMILYELLTGQLPFAGPPASVVHQIGNKAPEPPSRLRPELDGRLDAVCLKALAKKPADRFPDTGALVAALEQYLRVPGEQRLTCPQCGKRLKVPASLAGKQLKCPQCGASVATATVAELRPVPVPVRHETNLTSPLETAARPASRPAPTAPGKPAGRRGLLIFLLLGVSVTVVLLAAAVHFLSSRADGTAEPKPPGKDAVQKKGEGPVELADRFTNTVKMPMVGIKKGTFKMGSFLGDAEKADNEVALHLVKITRDFYMGATEVTRGQFKQFVEEDGYKTDAERAGEKNTWKENAFSTKDDQPVVFVSWNDAVAFCQWLSKKEDKKFYDLPTEAEWEYACRAGGKPGDAFCFGNDRAKLGEYTWFDGNSGGKTHAVGTKKANAWGLHDMHGNVWEWCKDGKRSYPDKETAEKRKDPIEDPEGPLNGTSRVLRGGSWDGLPRVCRCAHRVGSAPVARYHSVGFRVVLRPGLRAP